MLHTRCISSFCPAGHENSPLFRDSGSLLYITVVRDTPHSSTPRTQMLFPSNSHNAIIIVIALYLLSLDPMHVRRCLGGASNNPMCNLPTDEFEDKDLDSGHHRKSRTADPFSSKYPDTCTRDVCKGVCVHLEALVRREHRTSSI